MVGKQSPGPGPWTPDRLSPALALGLAGYSGDSRPRLRSAGSAAEPKLWRKRVGFGYMLSSPHAGWGLPRKAQPLCSAQAPCP